MKRLLPTLIILIIPITVLSGCNSSGQAERSDSKVKFELWVETKPTKSENANYSNKSSFQVKVADTDELRRRGLSGVKELGKDEGMLFVMPKPTNMRMWMKGCYIPLDVLYFDSDNKLINFHRMTVPAAGAGDYALATYRSDKPAKYALELAGGRAEELGVKPEITTMSFSTALLKRLEEGTE
ncbi:MAG: hypothetical protein GWP14_10965 [Actinobacteria bacterium]|nr:hypothetical protein [Actinomycetota bacterium]